MNSMQFVAVRVGLRRVAAGCDRDFDRARGVPRQGSARLALDIRRLKRVELARMKSRATPGSGT